MSLEKTVGRRFRTRDITFMTVHRYKSVKIWILRFLPFYRALSKFGADDSFHSGDIAAFVPGVRPSRSEKRQIFYVEKCFRIRTPLHIVR